MLVTAGALCRDILIFKKLWLETIIWSFHHLFFYWRLCLAATGPTKNQVPIVWDHTALVMYSNWLSTGLIFPFCSLKRLRGSDRVGGRGLICTEMLSACVLLCLHGTIMTTLDNQSPIPMRSGIPQVCTALLCFFVTFLLEEFFSPPQCLLWWF